MRKSRVIISIAAAAVCLLGLAGCTKDLSGKRIRFRASTRPEAPVTKTAYSGETYNASSKVYERIDWVDGDRIVLAMKNNDVSMVSQEYSVNTISVVGVNSKTDLEPYGTENGLTWGTGTHDFWAAYPASKVTVGNHRMSATIPSSQIVRYSNRANNVSIFRADMSDAFMVAGLQSPQEENGINLDFYPAFTAFEFTVGANDNTTITSFQMETSTYETETANYVPLAGVSTATFDASSNMSLTYTGTGTLSNTIGVVFHDDKDAPYNPIISTTASLNFKVFALPLEITGLKITFNLSDGTSKSLRLKQNGNWITFPAAAKIQISGLAVPGAVWYINFDYPRKEQWIVHPDIEIGVE
ncbi:MAG: fimbrillin family protein [Bacteroidales bacterium]|nr:fimbrillin family protein [Bacteroidales bacterium]